MTDGRPKSLVGWGVGVVAAGAAATVGVTADRLVRRRRTAVRLGDGSTTQYDETPDEERVVIADDGVPLHVEIDHPRGTPPQGDTTPTVVMTHGYTLNRTSWVFQRRALRTAGYRVVLWDHRGHGQSEEGEDASYDIDQLGRDLAAVIADSASEGPIVLVGHSMGGMTMMAFAAQHEEVLRERVVGAAFISTSAGDLKNVHWGLGQRLGAIVHRLGPMAVARLASQQDLVAQTLKVGRDVEEFVVHHFSFGSHVPLSIIRLTADMIFQTRLHVIGAFLPTLMEHHRFDGLGAFDGFEVLVMNGTDDKITPPEHSEAIVSAIPGAEHIVVRSAGHILPLEHPDLVNAQLLALLERAGRAVPRQAVRRPRARRTVTDVALRRRAKQVGSGKGQSTGNSRV